MEELIQALHALNPWWASDFQRKNYAHRTVQTEIIKTLQFKHVKDVLGVRRCGKSTLLYLVIQHLLKQGVSPKKIFFLSFDRLMLNTASFANIEKAIALIELKPEYLFLDEIQEKTEWERWVKQLYDTGQFKQIFVSGSNASLLSKEIGTLLTGRHFTTILFPFSFREYLEAKQWNNFDTLIAQKNTLLHHLKNYLTNGGFPETIFHDDAMMLLPQVYNDIIARDISTRYNVERRKVDLLAKYCFTNIGKEYSYNKIAKTIGLNIETVETYLGYFAECFLFFSLDFFSYKLKTQYKQNKKIYAIDTGLRNTIAFRFSEDIGRIYENTVFLELKRRKKEIYYWKNNKQEVDFVIREGLRVAELIQVCKDLQEREITGLVEAAKEFKIKQGIIITEDVFKEEKRDELTIKYIPLWMWLLKE